VRLAYLDCFAGISGDMALGALVNAGADLAPVVEVLRTLPIEEFVVEQEQADLKGISATRIHVRTRPQEVIRTFASIRGLVAEASMPEPARQTALRIYRRLAEAVAKVHGKEPELVTFHEWGELDCLVDIVGCAMALNQLGVDRVFASPVPTGIGMIRTEHGMVPLPRPEVMEMLHGVPTYSRGIPVELVTATGAAILASVSEGYGDLPMMRAELVGYGAGHLRLDFPNVLRVVIGEEEPATARGGGTGGGPPLEPRGDALISASVPDPGSDGAKALIERLVHAGAVEAWLTPAVSSEGARAVASAVVPPDRRGAVIEVFHGEEGVGPIRWTTVMPVPPK
jgi:pyridinium-3,5-bisthiocarboxylic acid mononucleotide nickel chelatase